MNIDTILKRFKTDEDGYYESGQIWLEMVKEKLFDGTLPEFHTWLRQNNWSFKLEKNRAKKIGSKTYKSNLVKYTGEVSVTNINKQIEESLLIESTVKRYAEEFVNNFELYCEYCFSIGIEPVNKETFFNNTKKIRI